MDEGALPHAEPPVNPVVVLFAAEDDPDPEAAEPELLLDELCEDDEDGLEPLFDEVAYDPEVADTEPLPEATLWVELLAG